jgi:hypothetical protein
VEGAYQQWRSNMVSADKLAGLSSPEQFDEASEHVTRDEIARKLPLFTNVSDIMEQANAYLDKGFTMVVLHNVNTNQEEFVEDFAMFRKSSK